MLKSWTDTGLERQLSGYEHLLCKYEDQNLDPIIHIAIQASSV